MPEDSRAPVLVGVGAEVQREEDPRAARDALGLMLRALERAAQDAGSRKLLERVGVVRVPRGFWSMADPGRLLAERIGAARARTELAEIGVLQTTLLARAARDVAEGRADVVAVVGGEARHRARRARALGLESVPPPEPPGAAADAVLRPKGAILSELEIRRGLATPVAQYAVIENALRRAEKTPLAHHRRALAALQAAFSRTAARNPDAWSRTPVTEEDVLDAGRNPLLAFPYGRLHASQWNVDQAAALLLCSVGTARALGVPRERWVYPWAVAESNAMVPLTERRVLHAAPGFAAAGAAALRRVGRTPEELDHLELYSCFPSAVRVQVRELGLPADRSLTLTGGMTFAGGPLNHFVYQALVRVAQVLRAEPGSTALVTAVSGMLTKQGVSVWSSEPPPRAFGWDDVTDEATRRLERVEVVGDPPPGPAVLAGATVLAEDGDPASAVLLADLPDGRRTVVHSPDRELAARLCREESGGRALRLLPGGGAALA